jgi:putative transposase
VARIARVIVPGLPHHITQRGNRCEPVFFGAEDYRLYRGLIATAARRANAENLGVLPDAQPSPPDRDAIG